MIMSVKFGHISSSLGSYFGGTLLKKNNHLPASKIKKYCENSVKAIKPSVAT